MSSAVVTARVSPETLALIDRVARDRGRSRSWFVGEAVRRAAEAQAEFDTLVQEGIDAIERGDVVPHDVVMAELEARIAELQAQCDK
jgi:predicted transcriptional regulator